MVVAPTSHSPSWSTRHDVPVTEVELLRTLELNAYRMSVERARNVGRHGKPVMVTGNGLADALDVQRGAFILAHLRQVQRAIQAGIDVRGYFYWSLLDYFEWTEGYAMRYGLAHVDFRTQIRSVRPSALLYRDLARASRLMAAHGAER